MFRTLRNAWKIVDLRKKILYTLFIILIFRIGSAISVPYVDVAALAAATGASRDVYKRQRVQHAINQLDNPMRLKAVRKEIAIIKTVVREKELKNGAEA